MLTIGLTGGIGSGKTTVANFFKDLGVTVIDADEIARIVVLPGKPALKKIMRHFGPEILDKNKQLDRLKLREKIFNDAAEKKWLETLLHPLIRKEIQSQITHSSGPYAILVIPLLVEVQYSDFISRVLVIDTSEALQIKRASERDQVSEANIKNIIVSQVSREKRLARADDVIINDADLLALKEQVKKMHQFYLQLAQGEQS